MAPRGKARAMAHVGAVWRRVHVCTRVIATVACTHAGGAIGAGRMGGGRGIVGAVAVVVVVEVVVVVAAPRALVGTDGIKRAGRALGAANRQGSHSLARAVRAHADWHTARSVVAIGHGARSVTPLGKSRDRWRTRAGRAIYGATGQGRDERRQWAYRALDRARARAGRALIGAHGQGARSTAQGAGRWARRALGGVLGHANGAMVQGTRSTAPLGKPRARGGAGQIARSTASLSEQGARALAPKGNTVAQWRRWTSRALLGAAG